jgi:hypothetical protein
VSGSVQTAGYDTMHDIHTVAELQEKHWVQLNPIIFLFFVFTNITLMTLLV